MKSSYPPFWPWYFPIIDCFTMHISLLCTFNRINLLNLVVRTYLFSSRCDHLPDQVARTPSLNTSVELIRISPKVSCFHACSQVSKVFLPMMEAEQCPAVIKPVCVRLIECREPSSSRTGNNSRKRPQGGGCRSPWPPGYCSAAHRRLKDGGGRSEGRSVMMVVRRE